PGSREEAPSLARAQLSSLQTAGAMSDAGSEAEEVADLSNPDVTTKYRSGGDIVNKALQKVVDACVEDADIATICEMSDKFMEEETGKLYNKKQKGEGDKPGKKIEKGIAFPTCISEGSTSLSATSRPSKVSPGS
ncbi:unnamed protein product, partial [Prorocentrum cordatum]